MGQTIVEKIIAHNMGAKQVKPGEIVTVSVDRVMLDDIMIPFIADKFHEMGFGKIWNPDRAVLIYDHLVPSSQLDDTRHYKVGDEFAEKYGIEHVHRSDGICHQLMTEAGYVKPGDVVFGTDSHTTTYGCVGAFSTGIGYTEMAAILGTGTLWVKVPETIKIIIEGTLKEDVMSKDIILRIIGDLGADGATYKSLEFCGSTVEAMSISSRMTMANMAIEAGCKNGIFAVDDITLEYVKDRVNRPFETVAPDPDAEYEVVYEIDLSALEPTVAFPHLPENTRPASELGDIKIDQVVIGSCTNGRMEDMEAAYHTLKGKKVAPGVRCIIIPATMQIYRGCVERGYVTAFIDAGAVVSTPTCGPCLGGYMGILAAGERCVSTTNRNFVGRMGHVESEVYLASPRTAAASALTGFITEPKEV